MKKIVKASLWSLLYMVIYSVVQGIVTAGYYAISIAIIAARTGNTNGMLIRDELIKNSKGSMIIATLISAVISMIILLVIAKVRMKPWKERLRINALSLDKILVSIGIGIGVLGLSSVLMAVFSKLIGDNNMSQFEELMGQIMDGNPIIMIIGIGIIVPIVEEFLFRGLIFNEFEKVISAKKTVIVTGLIFGLFHMNIVQAIYASALGIILGFVYYWTKSLIAPILIHITNNTISSLLSISKLDGEIGNLNKITSEQIVIAIISLTIMLFLILLPIFLRYLYKKRIVEKPIEEEIL